MYAKLKDAAGFRHVEAWAIERIAGGAEIRYAAGNRDPRSCDRAILDNLDALYAFAMSLTRNSVDAEDLVQEACLRAIKGAQQNGIKSDPKVWLFTILRNVWINEWRRRVKGPQFIVMGKDSGDGLAQHEWLPDEAERPEDQFDRNLVSGKIRMAVSDLPEAFREVVMLRYFEGFSYRQIAAIVGCPAGTIMSRLNRARAALRTRLDETSASPILQRKRGNE